MIEPVVKYFTALQSEICSALETLDGKATFSLEQITPPNGGLSQPRVLAGGAHIEKAAVQFTHSKGAALPRRQPSVIRIWPVALSRPLPFR